MFWHKDDGSGMEIEELANFSGKLVDIRSDAEWHSGHIPGALHIPMERIFREGKGLFQDGQSYLLYCASQGRSRAVCRILRKAGMQEIRYLKGGYGGYLRSGGK